MRAPRLVLLVALAVPGAAAAQAAGTVARSGVFLERYRFGDGLAFKSITSVTVPVTVTQRFGSRVVLDVGTAFATASVTSSDGQTIDHSGFVDTDVRTTITAVPGRLVLNLVGSLPTGSSAVPDTTVPLFGVTATDLLGFMTPGFGSGGGVSAGFATAFRMGSDWAIGAGASYRYGASYTPVKGGSRLEPGGDLRTRIGIEGPFGGGKYFRGAVVYTTTGDNDIGGGQQSAIGDRVMAYVAVSMPWGRSTLALYGWDMRRFRAGSFDTATVSVPRGNVLAFGARLTRPLSPRATVAPMLEFRHELTSLAERMELLGYLVRGGTDVRYRVSDAATAVFQAQLAVGSLYAGGARVSVLGPRLGALIEWSR